MLPEFSNLIGNEKAKAILSRLLHYQTIPQALLFYGPKGVGKSLFAQTVAAHLTRESTPDIHTLFPDPQSHLYPIASIRQLIQEALLSPFQAPCKVFILDDVEQLSSLGSNALLKIVEEPPPNTYFILLTPEPAAMMPTLLSRCRHIRFIPLSDEAITTFIEKKYPDQEAKKITFFAEGSLGKALEYTASPPHESIGRLFQVKTHLELQEILKTIERETVFEEILYWVREHEPLRLEEAIPLVMEMRKNFFRHIKLKTLLEHFFLNFITQ